MNNDAPMYVSISFILIVGAVFFYLIFIFNDALKRDNSNQSSRKIRFFAIGLLAWFTLISFLAYHQFFLNVETHPQKIALIIAPPLVTVVSFILFYRKTSLFKSISLEKITYLQSFRLGIESVIFYGLLKAGLIPELMTLSGRNPDILVGISAPFIAFFYSRKIISSKVLLLWNIFSLLLLINIVTNAVLSIPTPFQMFGLDQPNVAVLHFPFILLPSFLVVTAFFGHLLSISRLLSHSID